MGTRHSLLSYASFSFTLSRSMSCSVHFLRVFVGLPACLLSTISIFSTTFVVLSSNFLMCPNQQNHPSKSHFYLFNTTPLCHFLTYHLSLPSHSSHMCSILQLHALRTPISLSYRDNVSELGYFGVQIDKADWTGL